MSACGVLVLSVPTLLAVCLCSFPVLLLAELASLPDPTGSRLCAPPCCARSAPIPGELCSPVLAPAGCAIPSSPAAALFSVCSSTDPLRCHGFPQFSPCRVENDRTAAPSSGQSSQCPGMRSLCRRCSSMSLAISWQYKSR